MRSFLILPLLCLGLFGNAQNSEPFIDDFLSKWENALAYTLEYAEAMPADKYDYRPTEAQREFHDQLTHMCGNMLWLSSSYLEGETLSDDLMDNPPTDKEQVLELLKTSFRYTANAVSRLTAADLDQQVDFFAGPMSKRKVLFLIADHVTHHRGQMAVYLRLNGVEPPPYRGW